MNKSKSRKENNETTKESNNIEIQNLHSVSISSIVFPLLIILIGTLIYSNTFHNSFVFDDLPHIVELEGIHLNSFSKSKLAGLWEVRRLNGRPVALVSFALNYYLGGLNTYGYHMVNIIFHLLTAILVYFFLKQTLNLPNIRTRFGNLSHEIALLSWSAAAKATSYDIYLSDSSGSGFEFLINVPGTNHQDLDCIISTQNYYYYVVAKVDSCASNPTVEVSASVAGLLGDINNDGRVDGRDLSRLARNLSTNDDCLADLGSRRFDRR